MLKSKSHFIIILILLKNISGKFQKKLTCNMNEYLKIFEDNSAEYRYSGIIRFIHGSSMWP